MKWPLPVKTVARFARVASNFETPLRKFSASSPITPDFTTSVQIHKHTLRSRRADKLKEYESVTAGSLIPESLKHIEEDEEHKETTRKLREMGQENLTAEERKKRRRALDSLGIPNFNQFLAERSIHLSKKQINILQV
jgi:hypothetical protein